MSTERNGEEWSFDTDVVVVGSGGCGLAAAMAAAQGGAEVLVLEKQLRPWSNTARSGGMIPAAGTRFQEAAGIQEQAEDFAKDIRHKNGSSSDLEMTLHLAQVSKVMVEWLVDDVGVDLEFIDDFKYPGHSEFRMHAPPSRTGSALVADLRKAADAHESVEVITDAAGESLVSDAGSVIGVVVRHGSELERVRAQKVILASNGFAGNPKMVKEYCPDISSALYFGGEGNTGEGISWGQELGADVAFMDAYQAHASVAKPEGILITYAIIMEGGIQVNQAGARFGDESAGYSKHALAVLAQKDGTAWDIYDEKLHRLALKFEDYRDAMEADAIHVGENAKELAVKLGINADGLVATLDEYEAAADGSKEDPFGRANSAHLEPPFYGAKVTGALFHTQGGLVVDRDAQVLRGDGSPIPNLYAGGGVAAGLSGHGPGGYLSGNGLLTAIGYGMLAGKHASSSIQRSE